MFFQAFVPSSLVTTGWVAAIGQCAESQSIDQPAIIVVMQHDCTVVPNQTWFKFGRSDGESSTTMYINPPTLSVQRVLRFVRLPVLLSGAINSIN